MIPLLHMFELFISFLLGYTVGWLVKKFMGKIRHPMGSCNIGKKGISSRSWIAAALVLIGFFFEMPIVVFFAGFTWYESRAKWCVVQSMKK